MCVNQTKSLSKPNPRLGPLNAGFMPNKSTFTSPSLGLVATVHPDSFPTSFKVHLTYVGREGSAHEFLPLSLLGLSGVASVLEILQGGPKVLDIILKLVHSPEGKQRKLLIQLGYEVDKSSL